MDKAHALLEQAKQVADRLGGNLLVLVTDREELVVAALERSTLPVVLATGDAQLLETYGDRVRTAVALTQPIAGTTGVLPQLKELLLGSFFHGILRADDTPIVVASAGDAIDLVMRYDIERDVEVVHLHEELADDVDLRVVERLLKLSIELAREGREGHPVGTLFVLGDTDTVMRHSRPAVLNPFEGHPEKDRSILDDALWETAKEFAQIDGAFVVRGDGVVVAAGRYVDTEGTLHVQSGLGGRHLAAASISAVSRAVAIVVSSSGTIRIFKRGRVVMVVGKS
ncbi:MAG TPA: diadenylate cyclase [Candidatus Thermoplasmatota archaeon]|nr:diadenylate cyclase [Candidatus Thermoplasmatota archaeon]